MAVSLLEQQCDVPVVSGHEGLLAHLNKACLERVSDGWAPVRFVVTSTTPSDYRCEFATIHSELGLPRGIARSAFRVSSKNHRESRSIQRGSTDPDWYRCRTRRARWRRGTRGQDAGRSVRHLDPSPQRCECVRSERDAFECLVCRGKRRDSTHDGDCRASASSVKQGPRGHRRSPRPAICQRRGERSERGKGVVRFLV